MVQNWLLSSSFPIKKVGGKDSFWKKTRYLPKFLLYMTSTRGVEINVKLTYTSFFGIRSQILTVGDEIYNRNPETNALQLFLDNS